MLKLIVCIDQKNGIGKNNQLPWNLPKEMEHFKKTTLNHCVVMGHSTFKSIGKILPNRKNIIFSNQKNLKINGAKVTNSVNSILKIAKDKDVYVIGGKQIYDLFLPYVDQMIVSRLNKDYCCDVFFKPNWKLFKLKKTIKNKEFAIEYYEAIKDKIMNGIMVSNHIINELCIKKDHHYKETKIKPHLAIIQVGNNDASNIYIRNKINLAKKIDIDVTLIKLNNNIDQKTLNDNIFSLNKNKKIHGILIQSPLPKQLNINEAANLIDIKKDVDCFNAFNAGLLFKGDWDNINVLPCTPNAVMEIFKYYKVNLSGKNIVIIGRSNIVTKPLAHLLLKNNATITICHSKTRKLSEYLKKADIICSAAGKNNLIKANYVKKNVIIIDIAINRDEKNHISGDADYFNLMKKVKYITPVPGGVGPVTLSMLFKNLLNLYIIQTKK